MKDFAPNCPLYVQILKPENKFHVKFAGTWGPWLCTQVGVHFARWGVEKGWSTQELTKA